jgi:carboxylate-amine ligase
VRLLRAALAHVAGQHGLYIAAAGTHPWSDWRDQEITEHERYRSLVQDMQDVVRALTIFGLHVHIGVDDRQRAIEIMNEARYFLPHLLALSANSPFWRGRQTGLHSYRCVVWNRFPRTGIPEAFSTWDDFENLVGAMVRTGCIDDAKRIWWDIRPHPFFSTIEFRICDMPVTFDDTMAIAALCQALVAKLTWLYQKGLRTPVLSSHFIEENKWRVMHYGLDADVLDFVQGRRLSMRKSIGELLDFVDDVADDLGSGHEMHYLRALLEDPRGTGADRQIALYEQTGSMDAVIQMLMRQTMQGVPDQDPVPVGAD